jgi:hypothetical protein
MSLPAKDPGVAADIDEQDEAAGDGRLSFQHPYSSGCAVVCTLQSPRLYGTLLAA